MEIRLLVLRTGDPKKLADFYSLLGLLFDYHKHGNSPYHYSSLIGKTVLEIYPLAKGQAESDKNLRLGFGMENFEEAITSLSTNHISISEPIETDFGVIVIVTDPDGRKIELYKN